MDREARTNVSFYLFDFDGTLVDSMPYWQQVMLSVLDDYRVSYPADVIRIITPMGLPQVCTYFQELGVRDDAEAILRAIARRMTPLYQQVIPAKAGVAEKLRELKDQGKMLAILTASPHMWLDPCVERLGLRDIFEAVWSCNDFSTSKTDPAIYRMAAERLGQPVEKGLFLDDNLRAVTAAAQSGIGTVGVFDESSREDREQIQAVCDGYIQTFDEL